MGSIQCEQEFEKHCGLVSVVKTTHAHLFYLKKQVLSCFRQVVRDVCQASVVTVQRRGPLDGAVTLYRAGLGVVGSKPGCVHPFLQAHHTGLTQKAINPQRNPSVVSYISG